jgi:quercetin dioxygenase-like cupin family protein
VEVLILAKAGQIITHSTTGSKVIFIKTAEDTNGEYLEVEQTIKPASALPAHLHALQTETFHVLSGVGKYQMNGEDGILQAGEEISFAPGVAHINPVPVGNEDLLVRVRVSPALDFHIILETIIKASERGDANPDGSMKPLHNAVLFNGVKSKIYLAGQPIWLQKAMFPTLAFFGKLAGYKCGYPE